MSGEKPRPKVGFGVYVRNGKNELLFLKRKNAHGEGEWSAPGGHLEMGESFEEGARREVMEEAGVRIKNIKVIGLTNDIFSKDKHYITIGLSAELLKDQIAKIMELDKTSEIGWFKMNQLPSPLFMTAKHLMEQNSNCLCGTEKKYKECCGKSKNL